jgi:hypothetical protein
MATDELTGEKYSTGKPRFYCDELLDIYKTKGDQIFQSYALSSASTFLYMILFTAFFCFIFYLIGLRMYDSVQSR